MRVAVDGVIFQLQYGSPQGISRIWTNLLPEMITRSDIEIVLIEREGCPFPANINAATYQVEPFQWDTFADARALDRLCEQIKPDIFMSTYCTFTTERKNLLYVYDLIPEMHGWRGPEWDARREAILHADECVALSYATKKALERYYDGSKCEHVVYPGLDKTIFYPVKYSEVEVLRQSLPFHKPYILLVGLRGGYKKGNTVYNALLEMGPDERPAVLFVGGESVPDMPGVKQYFCINDDTLRAIYSGALALYYPSTLEGFGMPVLEAMACGCPVIVGKAESFKEFAGEAGYYLDEPDDPKQAADAIRYYLDEEHVVTNTRIGLALAQEFSWTKSANKLMEIIRE